MTTPTPSFEWIVYEDERAFALTRQTKTQERVIYAPPDNDLAMWFGRDRTDDRVQHTDDRRVELREEFYVAIAALFVRAGPQTEEWDLSPCFEDLHWYEEQFITDLRRARRRSSEARLPDTTEFSLPREVWDLIEMSRRRVSLTDWVGSKDPDDARTSAERGTTLEQFSSSNGR